MHYKLLAMRCQISHSPNLSKVWLWPDLSMFLHLVNRNFYPIHSPIFPLHCALKPTLPDYPTSLLALLTLQTVNTRWLTFSLSAWKSEYASLSLPDVCSPNNSLLLRSKSLFLRYYFQPITSCHVSLSIFWYYSYILIIFS